MHCSVSIGNHFTFKFVRVLICFELCEYAKLFACNSNWELKSSSWICSEKNIWETNILFICLYVFNVRAWQKQHLLLYSFDIFIDHFNFDKVFLFLFILETFCFSSNAKVENQNQKLMWFDAFNILFTFIVSMIKRLWVACRKSISWMRYLDFVYFLLQYECDCVHVRYYASNQLKWLSVLSVWGMIFTFSE